MCVCGRGWKRAGTRTDRRALSSSSPLLSSSPLIPLTSLSPFSLSQVCRESAPEALAAQRAGAGSVNYVLLNVDNTKWAPEVAAFGVRGVPHWVFLGGDGVPRGSAVGRLPSGALAADVAALAGGADLPVVGAKAEVTPLRAGGGRVSATAPRAHG